MAKYQLDRTTGIETISGAISRRRRSDGSVEAWIMTKKGRMYHRIYKRTTPLSVNEISARSLFSKVAAEVKHRKVAGDPRPGPAIFKEIYTLLKQQQTETISGAKRGHKGGKC
jgi:hypothetical protein